MGICKMQNEHLQVCWRVFSCFLRHIHIHWLCVKGGKYRATAFKAKDEMGVTQPSSSQVEKRLRWGRAERFSIHLSFWGKLSKQRAELSLGTSIECWPWHLSSTLRHHSSEREIFQNVKQKVLSGTEISVATKIFKTRHWTRIINRFTFCILVHWNIIFYDHRCCFII